MNDCLYCWRSSKEEIDSCPCCGQNAEERAADTSGPGSETKPPLDPLMRLAICLMESILPGPEAYEQIAGEARKMVEEVFRPVLMEWFDNEILTDTELSGALDVEGFRAQMWALECFGIGVEEELGNLPAHTGGPCLAALAFKYCDHAMIPLSKLIKRGLFTEEEGLTHARVMRHNIQSWSLLIWHLGRRHAQTVQRKNSTFLEAVKQLGELDAP